jgi:RNA polymerase sigma factor (sigma-70 family)
MSTEAELLLRYACTQDAEAFRAVVEGHQDMVYAVCRRVVGNRADAEDAAQECFLRLARHASELTAPIAGWLHAVAVHVSLDMLRRAKTRRKHRHKAAETRPCYTEPPSHAWREMSAAMDEEIDRLPFDLREPVVRSYLEQQTQQQIASALGVSQPAVSQRLRRAVAARRRRLAKRGYRSLDAGLPSLLAGLADVRAPGSLSAALGKMAIAGIRGSRSPALPLGLAAIAVVAGVLVVLAGLWIGTHDVRRDGLAETAGADTTGGTEAATSAGHAHVVVLGAEDGVTDMLLDLDTGRALSWPVDVAEPSALLGWSRRHGVDVLNLPEFGVGCLVGVDMAATCAHGGVVAEDSDRFVAEFDGVPIRDGIHSLRAAGDTRGGVYVFRTREGGCGVLRVERGSGAGIAVRVEYRLLRSLSGADRPGRRVASM